MVAVVAANPSTLDAGIECIQRWTLPMPTSIEPKREKAKVGLCFGLWTLVRSVKA